MALQTSQLARAVGVLAFALALALLTAPVALAGPGAVTGQVVDKDGAPFPFVDVFLEGEESAFNEGVLADEEGRFRFSPVPPGRYKLYAYATGFESQKFSGVSVAPDEKVKFEIKLLEAGTFEEDIDVDARLIDIVDTRRTEVSSTLSGDFVSKLPLQNKRIQDIVALFPGVVRSGSSDSSDISIGGGTSGQIGYRLDGASINDPVDGGAILDIPTAAISDFKLISTGFSAKYGEQSTGMASIITKRGTNELDFSYQNSFRSTEIGASEIPGLNEVQVFVDELIRADGSILENTVRQGFELVGIDQLSTLEDDPNPPARTRVRHTVSSGGPIIRDKVFFHSTLESVRDDFGGTFTDGSVGEDQILYTAKMNWDISEDNKLEATLNLDVKDRTGFNGLFSAPSTDLDSKEGTWSASATNTYIFNDTTFLESRFTATSNYQAFRPTDTRPGVGIQYIVPLPPGGPANYSFGEASINFDQRITSFRIEETLSKTIANGKHALEMGGSIQYTQFTSFTEQGADVVDRRVIDDTQFVMGGAEMGSVTDYGPPLRTDDTTWSYAAFIQDKWEVSPNFTIDAGLRFDYQDFVGDIYVSPRFGFSLDPIGDGRTRFFGNWGLYYDNVFSSALQFAAQPDQFFSDMWFANAFSGNRGFNQTSIVDIYKEALVTQFQSQAPDAVAWLEPRFHDTFRLSDNLQAPLNKQWSVGLERRLPANMRMQVTYTENRKTHQAQQTVRTTRVPQSATEFVDRDRIFVTDGEGRFRQWSTSVQKPFSDLWELNLSYVWSRNTGPIPPSDDPIDPSDVVSVNGLLGNDRTHVVKLQGRAKLPWKLDLSSDFTWQSGQPISAFIVNADGTRNRPFGTNTLRLDSSRQLNVGLRRPFQTADGKLNITAEVRVFNILNEFNVFGGLGRFEVPDGQVNPFAFPPLRPTVLPTAVDVGRSMEFGFSIAF